MQVECMCVTALYLRVPLPSYVCLCRIICLSPSCMLLHVSLLPTGADYTCAFLEIEFDGVVGLLMSTRSRWGTDFAGM
jgi:hypothetical protein